MGIYPAIFKGVGGGGIWPRFQDVEEYIHLYFGGGVCLNFWI